MDRRDDILRHFPELLARWRGADARLWTLSSSLPTLVILLYEPERPGCLEIACIGPERIEALHHWKHSNIEVEKEADMFKVVDTAAHVQITRCGVEIKEHDKKPWER